MKRATLCYIWRTADGAGCAGSAPGREYLMLYRNKKENDPNEGKWIGVGGKFEPGETPDECMLREVREETGLPTDPAQFHYQFCGVIHFLSDIWEDEDMYLYQAEASAESTDVVTAACSEGELRWVPEDQIMDLPMWEGDRLFLKPLLEGADSINMTLRYEGDKLVGVER